MLKNNINAPSERTMQTFKKGVTGVKKGVRLTQEAINNRPLIQKIIIWFLIIMIVISLISNARKISFKSHGKPFLPINYSCSDNQVFSGQFEISQTSDGSGCKICEIKNPNYSECCIIDKKNFNEKIIGEFTYSFWLYVSSFNPGFTEYDFSGNNNMWKHVWHRGNSGDFRNDKWLENVQYPGVWLSPNLKEIIFEINIRNKNYTISNDHKPIERIQLDIEDYNTWVNYSIVLNNYSLTIYVNGELEKTVLIQNYINDLDVIQNYNLYLGGEKINPSGIAPISTRNGFPGYLAYLVYFNQSYNPGEIKRLYNFYKKKIDRFVKINRNELDLNNPTPILINN